MSQETRIIEHLENNKTITPSQAWSLYGCMRLAARILDIKRNHPHIFIETTINSQGGQRHATYALIGNTQQRSV